MRATHGDRTSPDAGCARRCRSGAARHDRPALAEVRRLIQANASLGVSRAIRFTSTDIECCSLCIVGVEHDRADRIGWDAVTRGMPVELRCKRVICLPYPAARCPDKNLAVVCMAAW